ncbi:NADH-quinone oxidoreductase subunit C [Streptomyces sp. NPDC007971]|uniref:NADH-quinone oxidoreductase subunit C n=1 Tax=Streptomyces sp. NPDC007971 TaxID=3364799 RepID=UPI0036E15A85
MSTVGWLPAPAEELFGAQATAEEAYEVLTVDVPSTSWLTALRTARTTLSCTYFDWLSAVDEPGTGFRVTAHVVALGPVRRLLLRTTVPHEAATLPSAVGVYAGAAWHERETHEMFGVVFEGHPGLEHLLLPETFEGHPLRKDFVLAARVAKAWPGAKEPGESEHGGPKRRQMLPPGVPDPNEWGPLKGQLPPAPARPARGAGRAAGERPARAAGERAAAAGERPVRRARTAAEGSAGQTTVQTTGQTTDQTTGRTVGQSAEQASGETAAGAAGAGVAGAAGAGARPRRMRSASQGSVSQTAEAPATESPAAPESRPAPAGPRRARSASGGSASQRAGTQEPASAEQDGAADGRDTAPRSSDAPWHHARPAFDEQRGPKQAEEQARQAEQEPEQAPEQARQAEKPSEQAPEENRTPEPQPEAPKAPEAPTAPEDQSTPDDPTGGPQ